MITQTARRQSANPQAQATKGYRGQLGPEAIGDILKSNRTNASKARAAFLKSHAQYTDLLACADAFQWPAESARLGLLGIVLRPWKPGASRSIATAAIASPCVCSGE